MKRKASVQFQVPIVESLWVLPTPGLVTDGQIRVAFDISTTPCDQVFDCLIRVLLAWVIQIVEACAFLENH